MIHGNMSSIQTVMLLTDAFAIWDILSIFEQIKLGYPVYESILIICILKWIKTFSKGENVSMLT